MLGRPDREPRQCDIVITYGDAPRQTITIVEVQDRNSKPDITTFHGWIKKMQEVGAQHLICVSALGYPESIINDVAKEFGPTVRLMTLQEFEEGGLPPLILPSTLVHRSPSFYYETLGPLKLEHSPDIVGMDLKLDDPIFSLDDNEERNSLNELAAQVLAKDVTTHFAKHGMLEPPEFTVQLSFGAAERTLWLHIKGQRFKVLNLGATVKVAMRVAEVPMSLLSYRQEFYNGELAWLATAKGSVEGRIIETHVVFRPDGEGFLKVVSVTGEGAESVTLAVFENKEDFDAANAIYRKRAKG